jgi:hypothetical protein
VTNTRKLQGRVRASDLVGSGPWPSITAGAPWADSRGIGIGGPGILN